MLALVNSGKGNWQRLAGFLAGSIGFGKVGDTGSWLLVMAREKEVTPTSDPTDVRIVPSRDASDWKLKVDGRRNE